MDRTTVTQLLVLVGVPLLGLFGGLYRRFRQSETDEIESFSHYLTQGAKYYVGRMIRRQLAAELTLRQYARVHLRSTAKDMIVPARYPVSLKVDEVFVPLLLRGATRQTVEYVDLVEASGARFVVVGDPGSGKSSLMKRTFRDACRRASVDPRRSPVPVLVELRSLSRIEKQKLAELTGDDLFELCTASLREAAAFKATHAVEDLKHGAGYLMLLDGLDEVPSDVSGRVADALTTFASDLALSSPKSSIVISTRTQHYVSLHDRPFREAFKPLSIRPFSIADVYRFLLNWPFESDRADAITRLFSRIRQLPSLTEMCTNPLALSMFVARDQQTDGAISPETRTEFYSSLVDELLVNRRFRREAHAAGRQRLRQVREQVLGTVCLSHLLDPNEALNSVPEQRFCDCILEAGFRDPEVQDVLGGLAIDTGLFSAEREGETYRFMHLTLCEFLAAREVVNAGDEGWTRILQRLERRADPSGNDATDWASRLGEVVAFACGLAPRSLRDRIIRDLAEREDHVLLLRASMEAQGYADESVIAAVRREAESLAQIDPRWWDIAWFARLRWLIAVLRDIAAGARADAGEATSSVPRPASYLLSLIDKHGAEHMVLATLARTDADAALVIAEDSGRPSLMDVVVGAVDDFSVLVGILSRSANGGTAWRQALVHCALRQRQVAEILATTGEGVETSLTAGGWQASFLLKGSVYGRVLDDVLDAPRSWRDDDKELLETLARIKAPRRLVWTALRAVASQSPNIASVIGSITILAAVFVGVGALAELGGGRATSFSTWSFVVGTTIAVTLLVTTFRRLMWTRRDLRDRMFEVRVGSATLTLGSALRSPAPYHGRATVRRSVSPRVTSRLWRKPVLEEVLNLGRFRFSPLDRPDADERRWHPGVIRRIFTGVRNDDIRALLEARRLR
jgi:hypothetical protein